MDVLFLFGDPYGNRTHVTAVKGRCLNRLTNGPGSGNLIRTDDIPGMNRLLYQLSYAAKWPCCISDLPKLNKSIIPGKKKKSRTFFQNFSANFGNPFYEVKGLNFCKKAALFALGGGVYVGLEMLWRGRSHMSMFAAGGLCFLLLGFLRRLPLVRRLIWGPAVITAVELATGLLVNRDFSVWDYRGQPGNFLGQICPAYICLWVPLSLIATVLYTGAERMLDRLTAEKT